MDSAMGFSDMTRRGFPHSDICVSTPACGSTQLIAANHVLRRLLTPRHPPSALSSLTTSLSRSIGKLDSLRCRGSKSLGCCLAPGSPFSVTFAHPAGSSAGSRPRFAFRECLARAAPSSCAPLLTQRISHTHRGCVQPRSSNRKNTWIRYSRLRPTIQFSMSSGGG